MLHNIVKVRAMRPHRLHVAFDDGVVGELDVAQLVRFNGILRHSKSSNALPRSFLTGMLDGVLAYGTALDPVVIYSTITVWTFLVQ
jgi:hypothetical protein